MFIFNVLCMCVSECFVTAECRRSAASVVGHWGRGAPPMPGSASEQDRTGRLKTRELKTRHGQTLIQGAGAKLPERELEEDIRKNKHKGKRGKRRRKRGEKD